MDTANRIYLIFCNFCMQVESSQTTEKEEKLFWKMHCFFFSFIRCCQLPLKTISVQIISKSNNSRFLWDFLSWKIASCQKKVGEYDRTTTTTQNSSFIQQRLFEYSNSLADIKDAFYSISLFIYDCRLPKAICLYSKTTFLQETR